MKKTVGLALIGLLLVSSVAVFVAPGVSYAAKSTAPSLNAKLCTSTLDGTWDHGKSPSCTISSAVTANSSFTIPARVTLAITGASGALTVNSTATITNAGTIIVSSSNTGHSIANHGTIINQASGTITAINTGAGNIVIYIYTGATLTNHGTIVVNNVPTQNWGIYNAGTFSNDGTISFSAYLGMSITDTGSFSNLAGGTIILVASNSGLSIFGTFTNAGTILVDNSATGSIGILNYNTLINTATGTITIENSGTITYGLDNMGTTYNRGIIYVHNSGSVGLYNAASGFIYNCGGGQILTVESGTTENYGTIGPSAACPV